MQIELTLNPTTENPNPAPIYINDLYEITWADYTDPEPLYLLGFVKYFSTARKEILDLDYQTFWDIPTLSIDKYVVAIDEQNEWIPLIYTVSSIEVIENEP